MRVRDWLTVKEYAKRRDKKPPAIYKQIEQNRFPDPYDLTDTGLILIYAPQTMKTRQQGNFDERTCDRAGTK